MAKAGQQSLLRRLAWAIRIADMLRRAVWPIIGGTVLTVLTVFTDALSAFAPLSYGVAFLIGASLVALTMAGFGFFYERLRRAQFIAKASETGDLINPLEDSFTGKVIRVYDFAKLLGRRIKGKVFVRCRFVGEANVGLSGSSFGGTGTSVEQCDLIIVRDDEQISTSTIVMLMGCTLNDCEFFNCALFMNQSTADTIRAINPELKFVTYDRS